MAVCVFELFWRSENASMAAFAPFFKEPMISCHSFGKPVNCIWTSLQLQSTNIQKIHDQKCSFSLNTKENLNRNSKLVLKEEVSSRTVDLDNRIRCRDVHFYRSFLKKKIKLDTATKCFNLHRSVRFSSGVVCAFSALSLDTCGPHTGFFSYSLLKKLGAGPYGLYDKTSLYSKLTISGANDFSRTC